MAAEGETTADVLGPNPQNQVSTRGIRLTDDEIDAIMEGFENEGDTEKTWSRRLVENYLQHYSWYFPRKDKPNAPSLAKAWAYYEHVTLPRHLAEETQGGTVLRRAEPGEISPTELYKPLSTKQENLIEFGIGVDLYFQSVGLLCIMFLIAGIANIANIYYYATKYTDEMNRDWALIGSAVCRQTYWAVCEDCTKDQFSGEEGRRLAIAEDGTVLALRNDCEIGVELGIVNWATWIFFFLFLSAMSVYLRAREIRFDEDKLTASDYSILIKNPPPDAHDPDEWRDFLSQFAEKQVTVVSIHLNNEEMLQKLMSRRAHRDSLARLLPRGTNLDDDNAVRMAVDAHIRERDEEPKGCIGYVVQCFVLRPLRLFGLFEPAETLLEHIDKLTEKIKELQQEEYQVSKVFATFETEEGQRAALTALSQSRIDIFMNNTQNAAPSTVFRERLLRVVEPTEPTAVRWLDLSVSKEWRVLSTVATFAITILLIALAAYLEYHTRLDLGPRYSGPLVIIFNAAIPVAVLLMMIFERHQTEGAYQSSIYLKITLFRWMNTAVILQIITPFTSTLGDGNTDLLPSVSAILWSELFITPFIRFADFPGNLKKHVLGPRAITQEQMNLNFLGTRYNLAERYTDLTKVLFVCFFYSALFPAAFFFGFAILFVQYVVDKFCLLRIWRQSASLGNTLAVYSRRYFFTGATVAFIVASAYAWAQFPCDNLCDLEGVTPTRTELLFRNVQLVNNIEAGIIAPQDVVVGQVEPVRYCDQAFREQNGYLFPPSKAAQPNGLVWMSDEQETIVDVYTWSTIIAVVVFFVLGFLSTIINYIMSCCRPRYTPSGANQKIDFSCNPGVTAYYPNVKLLSHPFPFIAANVDDLDEDLLGFTDQDHSNMDDHNMIFDVPYPGMHRQKRSNSGSAQLEGQHNESERPIFGIVKHYPPPWWSAGKNR